MPARFNSKEMLEINVLQKFSPRALYFAAMKDGRADSANTCPRSYERNFESFVNLTLRAPRVLVPTPSTKGGGGGGMDPPSISRTTNATNLKLC